MDSPRKALIQKEAAIRKAERRVVRAAMQWFNSDRLTTDRGERLLVMALDNLCGVRHSIKRTKESTSD